MADMKKYLDTAALGTLVDQIKAEDAKVLQSAKAHAEGLGTNYDAAGSAATAESNAKAYTDVLADGQVKTNKEDIAKLNGDANTDGSVAKAIATAKATIDADIDAVEAIANQNKADIAAINNESTGILKQAKDYADGKAAAVQGEVDALEAYVGAIPEGATATDIVGYVQEKTAGIATEGAMTELGNRVGVVEGKVATIEGDYLKGADKTELEGKITVVETAVNTEKARAEGVESGLRSDVDSIKGDYLKATDKTELQGNIDTVAGAVERLTNGVSADEIDGVNDLINYVKEHGPEVIGMQEDIAENAEAISGVSGRVGTLESEMDAVEGAVATKAEKDYVDGKVEALQGEDTAIKGRLDVIEAAIGESGSVADDIEAAKQAAIAAAAEDATTKANEALEDAKKYADDEDAKIEARVATLETASGTHALASDLTALAGRVTTAEGEIDTLQSEMDAVEAKAAANEAAIGTINTDLAKKAARTDLEAAVARIAVNEGAISTLNTTIVDKAEADDLEAAVARIAKNEQDIAVNLSAINSFTAITPDEVNALFA